MSQGVLDSITCLLSCLLSLPLPLLAALALTLALINATFFAITCSLITALAASNLPRFLCCVLTFMYWIWSSMLYRSFPYLSSSLFMWAWDTLGAPCTIAKKKVARLLNLIDTCCWHPFDVVKIEVKLNIQVCLGKSRSCHKSRECHPSCFDVVGITCLKSGDRDKFHWTEWPKF